MMVMMKARLLPLLFLLASVTGVQVQGPQVSHVRAGEMVVLQCPRSRGSNRSGAKVVWTSHTTQGMDVITNMSSAEQMQRSMLVHMRSLVIFSASVYHQGNYSCSLGSSGRQNWFRLMVLTTQKRECEWNKTCYTEEACKLTCREEQIPNVTSIGTIWHKEGVALRYAYFPSVEENDSGIYTCTSSYLYHGQIYNMTSRTMLNVQLKKRVNSAAIISPRMNDVFHVDLGSLVVIKCEAVIYSEVDEVFWLIGGSFVERNDTLPVYYNHTRVSLSETNPNMRKMTASLIFKKVSEEDLLEKYTCGLDSESPPSTNVTITLAKKSHPSYVSLALCIICIVVVMVLVVVIYIKFKVSITLLLRDTLGCRSNISDGKSYDAFLMCYKSDTDAGLHEDDRKILESVLEARFGYSLCLFDRDVLPGRAVDDAVFDCIQQSRTVVLIPTSSDVGPGSGLLSAIHESLVERQTGLIFIKTEATEVSISGSLSEALQLLSKAGACVTWKGARSMLPSSSFWKHLRYYLPAPQHAPRKKPFPQKKSWSNI